VSWANIDRLTAGEMVRLASQRARVRMTDGRYARLIRWPSHHGNAHRGWQVRLENGNGARFSVHARFIEAVEVKEGQL
jgi:hypothetical protein